MGSNEVQRRARRLGEAKCGLTKRTCCLLHVACSLTVRLVAGGLDLLMGPRPSRVWVNWLLSDHRLGRVLCTMWSQTRYDLAECWNDLLDIWILLARGLGESVKFLAVWLWPSGPNEKWQDKSVSQQTSQQTGGASLRVPSATLTPMEVGNLDFCPLSPLTKAVAGDQNVNSLRQEARGD